MFSAQRFSLPAAASAMLSTLNKPEIDAVNKSDARLTDIYRLKDANRAHADRLRKELLALDAEFDALSTEQDAEKEKLHDLAGAVEANADDLRYNLYESLIVNKYKDNFTECYVANMDDYTSEPLDITSVREAQDFMECGMPYLEVYQVVAAAKAHQQAILKCTDIYPQSQLNLETAKLREAANMSEVVSELVFAEFPDTFRPEPAFLKALFEADKETYAERIAQHTDYFKSQWGKAAEKRGSMDCDANIDSTKDFLASYVEERLTSRKDRRTFTDGRA